MQCNVNVHLGKDAAPPLWLRKWRIGSIWRQGGDLWAVFGYVTATLATFFVGRDAENKEAQATQEKESAELREEVAALRRVIGEISRHQRELVRNDPDRQVMICRSGYQKK